MGPDPARLDRECCWIYGVRSLTLISATFSPLSNKMSTADCVFFHQRLKTEGYFWDQQAELNVTLSGAKWDSLPNMAELILLEEHVEEKTDFFVPLRANRGHEENPGHQETGALQEKAKWDHR